MNLKIFRKNVVISICCVFVIALSLNAPPMQANNNKQEEQQQTISISGTITDYTGDPLVGVSVVVKGSMTNAVTDMDGKYTISVPSSNSVLIFSYIGFVPVEKTVGNKRLFDIQLEESRLLLDEVVVVAYGVQKKETVTGSISSIKGSLLTEVPAANITNTLAGKLSGVTVSQNKGRPGDDVAKIYIRGRTTWVDSSPLIVIDGIEQERFDQLDPNEIESISVLKDASSTAVYGIRGANGVILVTTKKGMEGKPRINLSANWSIQEIAQRPEFLGSYEHMLLKRKAYENDGKSYDGNFYMDDKAMDAYRTGSDPYSYPDVNWYDLMLKGRNNPMQQYNLNVSGGTKRVKYFVSLGYLDQDGSLNYQSRQKEYNPSAYLKRINVRSNIDLTINKYVTVSTNISGRSEEINGIPNINGTVGETGTGTVAGYYQALLSREPWRMPAFNPDGSYAEAQSQGNPVKNAVNNGYENNRMSYFDIIGTLRTDLSFLTKGLSFDASYSVNNRFGSKKLYTDGHDGYAYDPTQDPARNPELPADSDPYKQISEDQPFAFSSEKSSGTFKRTALQLKLGYTRAFNDHSINTILVYNQQKSTEPSADGQLNKMARTLQGYAARVEYSFAKKYLAEVSMGYNGSENFAKGYRYGFFPAGSLGYIVTEEKFMEPIKKILPFFKIRGSIGLVGNDKHDKERFLYMAEYAAIGSPTNSGASWIFGTDNPTGTGGIYEKRGYSPHLTWETATKMNIGFDGQLFDNQLFSFSADFFKEKRKDILMKSESTPAIVGEEKPYGNIGETKGWGYELELIHRKKIHNVEYSIKANYNFARNKVLFKDDAPNKVAYKKEAGYRIGQQRGYRVIGFFQDEDEIKNSPSQTAAGGKTIPGDLKYEDVNEDGAITPDDMAPIGYSTVPEITYSISPSVEWKGIRLTFMLQGVANASMIFSGNAIYDFAGAGSDGQVTKMHQNYWTPENRNPSYPSLHSDPTHSNKQANSFLMQDASFLKLRDVNLSYNFPKSICKKMGMEALQVHISGTNLHTWTNMYNWDPETINSSGDYFPQQRVYNIGINVNF